MVIHASWAPDFKLGVYEHYKGSRYTALMIVRHHDTGKPMVVYASHEKGTLNVRPLWGWHGSVAGELHDPDGWLDDVTGPTYEPPHGYRGPRFKYIGPRETGHGATGPGPDVGAGPGVESE